MLAGIRVVLPDYDQINSLITFPANGNYKLFKFLLYKINIKNRVAELENGY